MERNIPSSSIESKFVNTNGKRNRFNLYDFVYSINCFSIINTYFYLFNFILLTIDLFAKYMSMVNKKKKT